MKKLIVSVISLLSFSSISMAEVKPLGTWLATSCGQNVYEIAIPGQVTGPIEPAPVFVTTVCFGQIVGDQSDYISVAYTDGTQDLFQIYHAQPLPSTMESQLTSTRIWAYNAQMQFLNVTLTRHIMTGESSLQGHAPRGLGFSIQHMNAIFHTM